MINFQHARLQRSLCAKIGARYRLVPIHLYKTAMSCNNKSSDVALLTSGTHTFIICYIITTNEYTYLLPVPPTHGRTDARTHGRTDARTHKRTHAHTHAQYWYMYCINVKFPIVCCSWIIVAIQDSAINQLALTVSPASCPVLSVISCNAFVQ